MSDAGASEGETAQAQVRAVCAHPDHGFSKLVRPEIRLIAGQGVAGDAHCGATTQHLFRKRQDPTAPNLAQVHFLPIELFGEMAALGYRLEPGAMGENVLTEGVDLATLPLGALFSIGDAAVVEISGLRDPCKKIDSLGEGLAKAMIRRDDEGRISRKAGIMGVVRVGGLVRPGDPIRITYPPQPYRTLEVV